MDFVLRSTGRFGLQFLKRFEHSYCTHINCWSCGRPLQARNPVFCNSCKVVQHPKNGRDYFEILNMQKIFGIDAKELQKNFKELQKQFHPDKHARSEKMLQEISAEYSSLVNQAFKTLNSPLDRGIYLLELAGYPFTEEEIHIEQDFLMKIMEINEELADASDKESLLRIGDQNRRIMNGLLEEINDAFDRKDYARARQAVGKLKFYANVAEKVKSIEGDLGITHD
ncbi:iron-sulfur cluster co-chaperone protein HscB-like isoform X2 [Artemia franciscana]|uniref:iron-sulfur cluster co-chaperone protein HscB-like isoform X2 n=1 Tax=Artemia franciscana TaxID=6661 RepID=UPI0032D9F3F6